MIEMLRASVIGNLGSDPELQYSQDGKARLRMNVASNYRAKNVSGNWDDLTEWVRVTVFGARAESLSQMLKKGQRIYCDGRLEARPWSAKDGSPRAGLEMIGDTVEFMSGREDRETVAATPRKPLGAVIPLEEGDLPF